FGVLTVEGRTPFGEWLLRIPNLVVRKLYAEQMQASLLPGRRDEAEQAARALFQQGDIQPLCEFVERTYFRVYANRDYRWANELTVKTAFLSPLFNDLLYIVDSEPALERGYADLVLLVRPDMRQYRVLDILIEFKYVPLKELGLRGAELREMDRAELLALEPVRRRMAEARAQLARQREALLARYGDLLRLRTFAVTALGFERLVCELVDW
ncbi:MAG TPA: AAA family ATPase, partial [Anaerolineae bacterium]|nr:AAA family ATPase [Anaerolineae bacterium]